MRNETQLEILDDKLDQVMSNQITIMHTLQNLLGTKGVSAELSIDLDKRLHETMPLISATQRRRLEKSLT